MAEEKDMTESQWWDEDAARLNALADAARGVAAKTPQVDEGESRALTISIDFDRTFAADPDLWGDFVESASKNGDTVVMISRRDDTQDNRDHITDTIGDYGDYFSDVLLIGEDTQKEAAAEAAGIDVDVWIDDSPHTITSRAFCPGASPPNNSCSPANKGQGAGIRQSEVTQAALASIAKTGGFSVHPATASSPTTGYMVSVVPESETILDNPDDITEAAVRDFYDRNKSLFDANPDLHLGGWVDRATGKTYFDLSARFEDIDDAIDEAVDRKQLAIWDLSAGQEIRQEDYDGRRTRPKAARPRAVRLSEGDVTEGHRGSAAGVREEGNRGDASERAFCPTGVGGGVDNSCSSKDGGGVKAFLPPSAPEPDGFSDEDDSRGSLTGHSREQRTEYANQLAGWLSDNHGVSLVIEALRDDDPPAMTALQAVADGVHAMDRNGFAKPAEIIITDQDNNAPAAYDFVDDKVFIDPDLNASQLRDAVKNGMLSGRAKRDMGAALVHEITHRDHWTEIAKSVGEDPFGPEREKQNAIKIARNLMGNPHPFFGQMTDPFDPEHRFTISAKNDGGQPLTGNEAREVAFEVSRYAMMNPLEFVAEVRTGVSDGIQYSDRVMRMYEDYSGPPLPKVKGRKIRSVNSKKPSPFAPSKANKTQRRPKAA